MAKKTQNKEQPGRWYEIDFFNGSKEAYKAVNFRAVCLHAHKEARERKTLVRSIKEVKKSN